MELMMKHQRQLRTVLRVSVVFALVLSAACSAGSSEPLPQQPAPSGSPSGAPTAGSQSPVTTGSQAGGSGQMANGAMSAGRSAAGTGAAGMTAAGVGAAGMRAAGMGASGTGAAGTGAGVMQPASVTLPVCDKGPDQFEPNASVGGGGSQFKDSPHFRLYGATDAQAQAAFAQLEAAYSCFVDTLCWRSSGLSINNTSASGPYYKMNFYVVANLGSAAGQQFSDPASGLAYEKIVTSSLTDPKVAVHEYGHALTYAEKGWINQQRTGAWWESVANFVADTFMTSPLCAKSRSDHGVSEGRTIIELNKVIGDSFQVIVDATQGSGNYYQAWPFLTYLTNNPDGYPGLGATALRDMFRKHMGNNETPLHVLERIATSTSVQKIVGRYWARMAYLDIGHKQAQAAFMSGRAKLNFANLDSTGTGAYKVKANRQPRYFGSNIIPLKGTGNVTVQVTSTEGFTATLAIRASSGSVRYVDLEKGSGGATLESGEEASLVVVNTPAMLYLYDPFMLSSDVTRGLDYTVQITGAMP
jgi:hypothetical protein